jgi:hypothetical protein
MLKGRAMRQKRDSALREFKSTQDSRLNALRARQRRELAALKDHHADELAKLRRAQGGERDDLALRQQQRFEREQALLRARQAGGRFEPSRADEVLFTRPEDASPVQSPEMPPETLREPRDGLSGVWDGHALPGGSGAAESGDSGDGRSEGGTGSGGGGVRPSDKRRKDEDIVRPAPTQQPEAVERQPEPDLTSEEVLMPKRQRHVERPQEPDADGRKGMFAKTARKADVPEQPSSPNFLDPDYEGPSQEELERARKLERAIRVHKKRQARREAEEFLKRERERDRDRDGPER